MSEYIDKILATVDNASEKAIESIITDWAKAESVDEREDAHAEMKAMGRVVKKLKRIIRETR